MTTTKQMPAGRRRYSNALRQRQRETTRKLIVQALAEIVAEEPTLAFSVEDVADKAGVSHRSVYRHFPTRKALFEALYEAGEDLPNPFRARDLIASADEIPLLPGRMFAFFDKYPSVIRALNVASMTFHIEPGTREESNKIVRQLLSNATSDLDKRDAVRAFAIIRFLLSGLAWQTLQERFGLDSSEAGKAVAWALGVLVADLEKRNATAGSVSRRPEQKNDD